MKVLFVTATVPWPLESGGRVRTYNLLRALAGQAELHLRGVREPGAAPGAEEELSPFCASVRFFERSRPGAWQRWSRPKLERWFHSPALRRDLAAELASGSYDLVHLDELLLARAIPFYGATPVQGATPVVQHHHKLDTVLYGALGSRGARRSFDLWKLRRLEAESARRYRHHVLCSEEDARTLRERYGALECAAVPSGFDPEHFRPSEPPPERDAKRLLFLGSMDYGPNVDAAVHFARELLPGLRARRPDVVLEIVGPDATQEVRALDGDGTEVVGRVPDVRPYLERAAMLVVPLRIGGGTRLKIVEALAMGTPVASTAIGAEGLGLEHGRHLVTAPSPGALVPEIERLLDDPAEARELGRGGYEHVHARYRWDALARELLGFWERAAQAGAPSPSRR